MNRKKAAPGSLVLALTMVVSVSAEVVLQCDIGTDKSPFYEPPDLKLKPGWTLITPPNDVTYTDYKEDHPGGVTVTDVNGTGIDLHFDVGNHTTLSGRDRYAEFPLAEPLAIDYFMGDDTVTVEDGTFYLTLRNLSAGNYRLKSYHNNPAGEGNVSLIYRAIVTGAVSAWIGDYDIPITGRLVDSNVGTGMVRFVAAGSGDVTVSYIGQDAPGYAGGGQLNAFELIREAVEFTLLGPNGGEVLNPGTTYQITWDTWGDINEVKIEYSTDNGSAWSEVDPPNTGNTGSYNWLIPAIDSDLCLVRVSDPNDPFINDTSDSVFTIKPVIFVDANATGAGTGMTWEDAYNHLQDALAVASGSFEIWVAQGTYEPDANSADPNGSGRRTATFQLISAVELYGGFPPGGGNWASRDPSVYETILSGDLDGNDVDVNDPCDLASEPTRAENSWHVVTGSETEPNAVLDGFVIIGGNANGSLPADSRGGGMNNVRGSPTVTNCTFKANSADHGGAVQNYVWSGPILTDCVFSGNYASGSGGAVYSARDTEPSMTNCLFTGNRAGGTGGAMQDFRSDPNLVGCAFSQNRAPQGGAICGFGSGLMLMACSFVANHAGQGGALYQDASTPNISNCSFSGNLSDDSGAILAYSSCDLKLTNCTFAGNSAAEGRALTCDSDGQSSPSNVEVTNCILWDDGGEISNNDGSTIGVTFSNVQGGWPGLGNVHLDPCFVEPGYWANGGDPSVTVEPNDPNAVWVNGDYHLKSEGWRWDSPRGRWHYDLVTSRCIDAGSPGWLLLAEPPNLPDDPNNEWGQNIRVNMGAYGRTTKASMPPYGWTILSDMTNDGRADLVDFVHLAAIFAEQGSQLHADLDRDGDVDYHDLRLVAEDWLKETSWH